MTILKNKVVFGISCLCFVGLNLMPYWGGIFLAAIELLFLGYIWFTKQNIKPQCSEFNDKKEATLFCSVLFIVNVWSFVQNWINSSKVTEISESLGMRHDILLITLGMIGAIAAVPATWLLANWLTSIMSCLKTEKDENNAPFFDKKMTNAVKGIAIICMFSHHLFTFPEDYVPGVAYPELAGFAELWRKPFRICVPVFAFMTGYFYFYTKRKTIKYSVKKISDLLVPYWMIYFAILVIAKNISDYNPELTQIIFEAFGLKLELMKFCWYVSFYIALMLIFPIFVFLTGKVENLIAYCLLILPVFGSLIAALIPETVAPIAELVSSLSLWLPVVFCGYAVAECGGFSLFDNWFCKKSTSKTTQAFLCGGIIILSMMGRKFCGHLSAALLMDVLYAPAFIYGIVKLLRLIECSWLNNILGVIGRYSMQMWFIHCIFFNAITNTYFQTFLYKGHTPILVLLKCCGVCLTFGFVINCVSKPILSIKNKIFHLL